MTVFQGYDGELRLISYGYNNVTRYLEVLFCDMNFTGPLSRPRTEEILVMHRGVLDSDAHYIEGSQEQRYLPISFSFSCKLADTVNSQILTDWLSGCTVTAGSTQLYSWKGKTKIDGVTLPAFAESTAKYAYRVEVKWDGTNDIVLRYDEVYFPHSQQSLSESIDGITLSANGQIYGDVTRVASFMSNVTSII